MRAHRATGNTHLSTSHSRVTTGPEGWLIGERPLPGERGDAKWYFSTLPADTPPARLLAVAHQRWVIEQFYEDAKGECGLDHYQGRRWDGLHRHVALTMLAYSFLQYHRLQPAAAGGFPPLSAATQPAGGPSRHPALALPGPGPLAHRHRPDRQPHAALHRVLDHLPAFGASGREVHGSLQHRPHQLRAALQRRRRGLGAEQLLRQGLRHPLVQPGDHPEVARADLLVRGGEGGVEQLEPPPAQRGGCPARCRPLGGVAGGADTGRGEGRVHDRRRRPGASSLGLPPQQRLAVGRDDLAQPRRVGVRVLPERVHAGGHRGAGDRLGLPPAVQGEQRGDAAGVESTRVCLVGPAALPGVARPVGVQPGRGGDVQPAQAGGPQLPGPRLLAERGGVHAEQARGLGQREVVAQRRGGRRR